MSQNYHQPHPHDAVIGGQLPVLGIQDILTKLAELQHQPTWNLVYAHDCYGQGTMGDLNRLMNAIRNGHRIRLVIDYVGKDFEYATEAEHLWIRKGTIFAQNASGVSTSFSGDRLRFNSDFSYSMIIVNTAGELEVYRWQGGDPKKSAEGKKKEFYKVAVRWFADVS